MKSFLLTLTVLVFLSQVIPGNLDLFRIEVGSGEWVLVRGLQGLGGWAGRTGSNVCHSSSGKREEPSNPGLDLATPFTSSDSP